MINALLVTNYAFVINAYGDGPIRLLDTINGWQVVIVDNGGIIATLFDVDKTAVSGDQALVPIYRVKDYRTAQ